MKKISEHKLEELLSQYIDGVLTEKEIKNIESLIASDEKIRKHIEELVKLRQLLSSKQKLSPDIGFWTRFSSKLEQQNKEERSLIPFPRKFIPAVSLTAAAIFLVLGIIVVQNRMQFIQFFSAKSLAVRDVYEKKIQSSLLPLFSNVDKDKALQFSLFGTLPLEGKSEAALRVDEQSEKGYRIEFGKDSKRKVSPVTFDKFVADVQPTNEQKKIIDSLLEITGRRIESSVFIGENNTMAIAPDLPPLNKIMVTNIASCLEPNQRVRFERLLEENDAPYSVKNQDASIGIKERSLQKILKTPRDNRFMIITPDTIRYSQIQINIDSIRKQMEEDIIGINLRRDAMLQRMMTREFQRVHRNIEISQSVNTDGEDGFFSVEIRIPNIEDEQLQPRSVIQPRVRKHISIPGAPNHPIKIQVWKDSTKENLTP